MNSARRRASPAFSSFRILITTACLPLATILACSAGGGGDTGGLGGDGSGAGNSTQSTSSNGQGGAGASSGSDGVGGLFNPGVGGGNGTGGSQACSATSAEAKLKPVNMFIAIDKSGSMSGSKWNAVESAFPQFFSNPAASNLNVALRFWPTSDCDDPTCNATACAVPKVPLGPLSDPNHVQALNNAIVAANPDGSDTPTSAALDGATKWAANYMVQNPGEKAVVLLVTDGDPNGCSSSSSAIFNIAQNAYQGAGVLTFAIGMQGATQSFMQGLAQAGGTTSPYIIDTGTAVQQLLDAMKQIQGSAVSCDIAMPDPPPGKKLDPSQVEVTFTPQGGMPTKITKVADVTQCTAAGGFYYDNPAQPTKIILCPETCKTLQAIPDGKLELNLGCLTDIN